MHSLTLLRATGGLFTCNSVARYARSLPAAFRGSSTTHPGLLASSLATACKSTRRSTKARASNTDPQPSGKAASDTGQSTDVPESNDIGTSTAAPKKTSTRKNAQRKSLGQETVAAAAQPPTALPPHPAHLPALEPLQPPAPDSSGTPVGAPTTLPEPAKAPKRSRARPTEAIKAGSASRSTARKGALDVAAAPEQVPAQVQAQGGLPAPAPAPAPAPPTQPAPDPAVRPTTPRDVLLVVDGNYLANRTFFGYGKFRLTTSSGVPTSVTYGVIKTLHAAIRSVRPAAVAVVFDPRGPTFRSAVSLLDPSAPTGAAVARLVRQGRLDWQDLAARLLSLECIRSDILAAAQAEAAATDRSYLHESGSFLGPSPYTTASTAASAAEEELARPPAAVRHAAAALKVLTEALGPELAAELGLLPAAVAAGDEEAELAARVAALLPSYKAGRTPHTDEFREDLRNLQRLLGLMRMPPLCRPWLEADDLMGLLAQEGVRQGMAVRIVSGDRDLMQLVNDADDVALLYPAKKNNNSSGASAVKAAAKGPQRRRATSDFPFDELREAEVVSALGVAPSRVVDYKALAGDASDQLPGVTGIGAKTAAQLLEAYGSLRGVLDAAGALSAKRRESLQADWPSALYTQAMARVLGAAGAPPTHADVLGEGLLQRLRLQGFDPALVVPAVEELEMRSLARGMARGGDLWADFGGEGLSVR